MQSKTKYLVNLALLSAIAYVLMVFGRVPVVSFLKYDPKDIVIVIGGLIYGPMASFIVSVVVSFLEMITVSETAWIGFAMNVLSTCSFACTAAWFYKKKPEISGAVAGLVIGGIFATVVMLLWNYLLTPIYMELPRAEIAKLLPTTFLPFNLLKVGLNGAMTVLVYKPVVNALRKAGLIPPSQTPQPSGGKRPVGVLLVSGCVLLTCVLFVLAYNKLI